MRPSHLPLQAVDPTARLTRRACLTALTLTPTLIAAGAPAWVQAADSQVLPWPKTRAAPPLDGVDLDGRVWSLVSLRGRAVLLNFWATWCEPCVEELPALQALARREPTLQILLLNHGEPESRVRSFAQRQVLTLPLLPDVAGRRAPAWGVRIFPSSVLLDAQGQPRWLIRGAPDWAALSMQALLEPLLPR